MNKILASALSGVMALTLTACGSSKPSGSEAPSAAGDAEKTKLTLMVSNKNDLSFNQSACDGVAKVAAELSDKFDTSIVEVGMDTTKWDAAYGDVLDNGTNWVIGIGYQNKDRFATLAQEYPDVKFLLFDTAIDYSANEAPNVLSGLFKADESGYLAGAAAAMKSATGTIGFVGGLDNTSIQEFLVGYAQGAKEINPEIKVLNAFVGDFKDSAKAKELANAQISNGADVLFQVAGGAGIGVIEAAAEAENVYAIGVDSDQYQSVADEKLKEVIMTSALKGIDNAIFKICSDYVSDPESVPFGTVVTYGMDIDGVGIVFNDKLTETIGAENVAKLQELHDKIKDGSMKVTPRAEMSDEDYAALVG